ncbi:aldolase [Acidovorax facilis]|jgi:3-dehydro-4-phosphotetronate decarboxylase|uniref:class II aldolase/adducin family protein n=1 Tax=Acidovorax facilis TaxID=12917 RepID=UPI003D64C9CE
MREAKAREEICRVGSSLFERGYVHATAGNISFRLSDDEGGGFLITPTDACLGNLDPGRLAKLDADGRQLSGDRASKTIELHRKIYRATESAGFAAGCVLHTHSTYCVLATLGAATAPGHTLEDLLPPITPYFVMKVGHVPVIPYYRPGAPEAAAHVEAAIADYGHRNLVIRAVMLERLGPTVWHCSPAEAMAVLEELEETAKLVHLAGGSVSPLDPDRIDVLRKTFGASW